MSSEFILEAEVRAETGKGASRRLRRLQDRVPAIVYGGKTDPQMITLAANKLAQAADHENFFTSLVTINIGGKKETVVVKDLQRHPAKWSITHADFQRVSADTKIHMHVPLHFIGVDACPGVKTQGGVATFALKDIEVACLPKDLPEYIAVDMSTCVLGQNIHISDLILPAGVESVALHHGADHDLQVASIHAPRGGASDEETAATAAAGEGTPSAS